MKMLWYWCGGGKDWYHWMIKGGGEVTLGDGSRRACERDQEVIFQSATVNYARVK